MEAVLNPIRGGGPVHIKKNGNVATIFVDMVSETPIALADYDDSPDHGFPVTLSVTEAVQNYGNRIVWHEAPRKENPIAKLDLTPEQLDAKIRDVIGGQQPELKFAPAPAPTQSSDGIESRVLSEFKLLLVRYSALEGKKKAQFGVQVTAVAMFILSIAPQLSPALEQLKNEINKPTFSL